MCKINMFFAHRLMTFDFLNNNFYGTENVIIIPRPKKTHIKM